jgi:sec-independent protein translocase protein TatB
MFGVGYSEAIIIAVAALVIFGPHRLPELAGQAGRWIREFRKMTSDLTGEFEKTIAEVDDIRDTVRREMKSMMDEVEGVTDSVKSDLGGSGRKGGAARLGSGAAAKSAAKPAAKTQPAKAAAKTPVKATSKPAANGKAALPAATKADPLVDVSMLDDDLLGGPKSSNGNGAAAPPADPALERVRQRRIAAGYSRRA